MFNKDPNKGETLQNIDFGESIRPDFKACMYDGNIGFNSKEKKTKIVCCSFVLAVILMILALFFSVELKKETLAKFLFYISLTYFICFYIYFTLYSYSVLWFLYVKFFKWLGFAYFEKDFIKTIKKHNLFAISIFYYENKKRIRKIKIKSPTFIK
ncbi:hypothetical protein [Mulberry dwarf phytoplasma]|uniref:hypothetical protein n=1 Tax=Mulberry dwarf phytoplasma TaxID=186171 RepID=UPI001D1092A2|nr:hypothetical protein [Mulberry dwarf phytoplasma]